ncbi:carbohydrate binding family 9 domain-containing protein [candidate division KSB1 bacterium]|nr:carbohydrate binding family 9 domain-containing protein [candidate division KSB1 bacterium]
MLLNNCLYNGLFAQPETRLNRDNRPKRIYYTQRIKAEPPKIDGCLNDKCWEEGNWAAQFTQFTPYNYAEPSCETEFKILYDDTYLYVAIRSFDDINKIERQASRRDVFSGDIAGISIDSYHDLRTSFEFNLTAAGGKVDLMLIDKTMYRNWDAVWYGRTALEDSAWTAEMKIPFSQLRFANKDEHVWGMQVWRQIKRYSEEDQWNVYRIDTPSVVDQFGELHGIKNLKNVRRIELLPYSLSRQKIYPKETGNPFADGRDFNFNMGLDGKIGISSDFTMDFTINPDFGQVEADPSTLNLTAFETFYEEKRPFFLEGENIFDFRLNGDRMFYTRRIGQRPSYDLDLDDDEYSKYPEVSTILNAVKLSGKSRNGLSLGILQSITSKESCEISTAAGTNKLTVEPMSNYFVTRILKDFDKGNTSVGGILTSTNRFISDSHLNYLGKSAYTAGFDLKHYWKNKTYFIDVKSIFSQINGDGEAIYELQQNSRHYYQRPDADYLKPDSTLTHLAGSGGHLAFGKGGNGKWLYSEQISWRSPGLDLNDLGYLRTADIINQETQLSYEMQNPNKLFRNYSLSFQQSNEWDFGGNMLEKEFGTFNMFNFLNNWVFHFGITKSLDEVDNRILRGGPAMKLKGRNDYSFGIHSDNRKNLYYDLHSTYIVYDDNISTNFRPSTGVTLRLGTRFNLSSNLSYTKNLNDMQYVTTESFGNENRYILGRIEQETVNFTFRMDICLTPDFSIQYYGSPYISSGKYSHLKRVTNPLAKDYNNRFHTMQGAELVYDQKDNIYHVDENLDGLSDYTFDRPDFNFQEFRSNLVLRWEYKPGSTFYFVWTHGRSSYENEDIVTIDKNFDKLWNIEPQNIFMIKFNYWFTI